MKSELELKQRLESLRLVADREKVSKDKEALHDGWIDALEWALTKEQKEDQETFEDHILDCGVPQ